ncbi:probable protein phosphatase 2C 33 [Sesamum indicum]|uniref:protein-serine/threonine phosphatase n=1 Tax=Sesamum indicum TaxID=4182 RepID=A0A6I9T2J7_SESIN|nr:probable protein phosphatase 2C 33 [Sesamum indicum]XP_011077165.1 probable protein phosphatase 2C 33 [Sesamum indicum]
MGSCLSGESRSPGPGSPNGVGKRKGSRRRLGSRSSSFDFRREEHLHRTPGRMFLNGCSEIASLYTQQGKKGTNQDAMIVWENFGSRTDTVFCGVFDGHGPYGHLVAKRVRDSLPLKLSAHWEVNIKSDEVLREVSLNTTGGLYSEDTSLLSADDEARASVDAEETGKQPDVFQTLKESFLKAFKAMDRELRMYANIDCFCSGTTAVTLVKQGQDLVIGNVGDSRAVLATRDENNLLTAVQLTVDLKPNLPAEAERIRKCKGRVFALHDEPEVARVWLPNNDSPGLAMARAFGDFCLKEFGLISVPEISYRCITDKDEFIVLATDGIWDVLSNKEVVEVVGSCRARSNAARTLVESAVRAWKTKYPTSKVDDCAVVCLFLDSNESAASTDKSKENIPSPEQDDASRKDDLPGPIGLSHSGVVGAGDDDLPGPIGGENEDVSEANEEVDDEVIHSEGGQEWSALEGVSRVNTLLTLPRFVPGKEDEKAAAERKVRK